MFEKATILKKTKNKTQLFPPSGRINVLFFRYECVHSDYLTNKNMAKVGTCQFPNVWDWQLPLIVSWNTHPLNRCAEKVKAVMKKPCGQEIGWSQYPWLSSQLTGKDNLPALWLNILEMHPPVTVEKLMTDIDEINISIETCTNWRSVAK